MTTSQQAVLETVSANMWGNLMRGQEEYQVDEFVHSFPLRYSIPFVEDKAKRLLFYDSLHPAMFPGGYLWADMMLYDLKVAVARD